MFYYAEIDSEYLVVDIHALSESSTNPNYIPITEEQYNSGEIEGKYYNFLLNIFEIVDMAWYMGDSPWVVHKHTQMPLSTKIDNMDAVINSKADENHTHTEYASSSDLTVLEDTIATKADASHTHTGYANTNHTHDEYATVVALDTIGDELNDKADVTHTHSEYASVSHEHSNYATQTSVDSLEEVVNEKADSAHNHDAVYAGINHNHSGVYSDAAHNHNGTYSAINHNHDNVYAEITIVDEIADDLATKADSTHTHNDIYYTETEIDTKLANKSDSTHNHTGIYDVSGAAASALSSANAHTDEAIDTLSETVATKANSSALTSHTGNTTVHITSAERTNWNAAKNHADSAHAPTTNATQTAAGLMSKADKAKLDGIAEGANNYTLPSAGSALGGVKSGGDVTISAGVITVNDDSHNHIIANIDGLQSVLNEKAASGHNHDGSYYTETEVDELLEGKANTSHTHAIANVTNLQSALDGKAATSHGTHVTYSTTAPVMDGSASVGTASTVARSDHKHPTDTSRAAQTALDTHTSNTTTHITSTERTNWGTGYTHSQAAHAPSDAQKNQNAFSYVKVGTTSVAADSATDTLTLVAGSNVTITPDATGDSITISSTDTNTTYSASNGISLSGTTFSNSGVRSIATGGTNGTIAVNTNGTATNVAVKGLGSAAYTNSSAYDAAGTAQTKADSALASAKSYTDTKVANLINGAPTTLDTLKEIADAMAENNDVVSALNTAVGTKANASDLTSHTSNKSNPHGVSLSQLGLTATAAELNKMDGITATTAELNKLDGVTATTAELNYVDGVTSNIQTQLDGKSPTGHTHNYAGSSSAGGAATSANKLNTNAGSGTQPVYFANGVPVATTYTLGKSVPSNAVFTDTDTKVTNTLATTTKAYVTGTTSASTNTGTQVFDTGVYLDTVAGKLVATTFSGTTYTGSGVATVAEVETYLGI